MAQVQADLRRRILRAFVGRGLLEGFEAKEMLAYQPSSRTVLISGNSLSFQRGRLLRATTVAPNASSASASVWGSGTAAATSPGQRLMLTQARCTAGDVAGCRAVEK